MARQIIIVRHGRTQWNDSGKIQGSTDIALDEIGIQQAAEAENALAAYKPDRVVSSDLMRASETAAPVAKLLNLDVELDARLQERAFGPWEGLTMPEISKLFPEDHARWRNGKPVQNPGIESWETLRDRTQSVIHELMADDSDTVMVFTHGGSARQLTAGVLGWDFAAASSLAGLDNVHWVDTRLMKNGSWRMYGYNLGVTDPADNGSSILSQSSLKK